jgi:starch phosphorylase
MTTPIKIIDVIPKIPEPILPLRELAGNMWFAWNYEAQELFRRINPDLWEDTHKNPVELLFHLRQDDLESLAVNEGFLAHLERVKQKFDRYIAEKPAHHVFGKLKSPFMIAYFTAECGVADCLPIYSGGLGILSGDHLKSASDLNLPLTGISLAYQKGYFRQYLTQDGWQMETYPVNQFPTIPVKLVRDPQGQVTKITLDLKGEKVWVQAWQVSVGRIKLFLLDTNLPENTEWSRTITAQLYGGDKEMRIRQEMVLGIGGIRMLRALNIHPSVFHMNEGHSAFAAFERVRELKETLGLNFDEAKEYTRVTNVFTTHTPVPAGIDTFHPDLIRTYFEEFAKTMGISFDVLAGYGRINPRKREEEFSMAVLALRFSTWNNAVSRLHSHVSRRLWNQIWPKTAESDLPIGYVTNGVHIPSWVSAPMAENYYRYLGPRWIEDPDNVKTWERVEKIPDTELWRTKDRARERLVAFARKRLKEQLARRGHSDRHLALADEVLNTEALTIGFGRRFARYKRADLILHDIQRLEKILTNAKHPVQIIFAGKAHPQDNTGKELIKWLVQTVAKESLRHNMVFLEDYDMEIARHLVQGADIWLNTPRRPNEACGTSGMKAVANGVLHVSVLDGWWDEGFERDLGWAIGNGEEYQDHEFQDELESRVLYDILETDIIPLFYDRGSDGLPRRWIAMMKASMHKLCPQFNTHRMVDEYWKRFYLPAAELGTKLLENNHEYLKQTSNWRQRIMFNWGNIVIQNIRWQNIGEVEVGTNFHVETDVFLSELSPDDVVVEAYFGFVNPDNQFLDRSTFPLTLKGAIEKQTFKYQADIQFQDAGHLGLNIRITPRHFNEVSRHAMGLVVWGKG